MYKMYKLLLIITVCLGSLFVGCDEPAKPDLHFFVEGTVTRKWENDVNGYSHWRTDIKYDTGEYRCLRIDNSVDLHKYSSLLEGKTYTFEVDNDGYLYTWKEENQNDRKVPAHRTGLDPDMRTIKDLKEALAKHLSQSRFASAEDEWACIKEFWRTNIDYKFSGRELLNENCK
jgi:hypothetical protein